MAELSAVPNAIARKSLQALLHRLAKTDLATIGKAIGKSESTACRLRDGEASLTPSEFCDLLEAVGYKIVDARKFCVDREVYEAMSTMATRAMRDPEIARARWTKGSEIVDTTSRALPGHTPTTPTAAAGAPLTVPWPPSGNHAVKHANGAHYLRPEVIAYRDSVADLCAHHTPTAGRYRLHVHLSPPDARTRDIDNALKSLFDALVKGGYLHSDSMTFMRELVVTVDDERRGRAIVRAVPIL